MCVLTYVPHGDKSVTITHNRDEHIQRPVAIPPKEYLIENQRIRFPKDPLGGGTWFASNDDWVVCLLNGAFEVHERKATYRESRGKIITGFFQNPDMQDFIERFDPIGIEPFTFVAFNLIQQQVYQMIWDEKVLHIMTLDATKPHIWSSATLYNQKIRTIRGKIFQQFCEEKPNSHQILDFHKVNIDNDLHKSFFVNINDVIKTVAITQISTQSHKIKMNYLAF